MGANMSPTVGSLERLAGTELRANRRFVTRLTLALMEDVGYYVPDYNESVCSLTLVVFTARWRCLCVVHTALVMLPSAC